MRARRFVGRPSIAIGSACIAIGMALIPSTAPALSNRWSGDPLFGISRAPQPRDIASRAPLLKGCMVTHGVAARVMPALTVYKRFTTNAFRGLSA